MLLGRRHDGVITTAITTIVIMVVAILNPADALRQPPLRLLDTVLGVAVGVACNWGAAFLFRRIEHNGVTGIEQP